VATSAEILHAVLGGGHIARPLIGPLASAAAGTIEALEPEVFLHDVTKLTNLIREFVTSLRADIAVAEFGTFWDAEILGAHLDWSSGLPVPRATAIRAGAPDFAAHGRGPVVIEVVTRLRKLLSDQALVAAGVTGPATLSALFPKMTADEAARLMLEPVRRLCESGAQVIFVVEAAPPPSDLDGFTRALASAWGTIRFYRGLGVLHLQGAGDAWLNLVRAGGPYLPCFDPKASPGLAAWASAAGRYGLGVPPGSAHKVIELARTGRCALFTNDGELAGRVDPQDLYQTVAEMRAAVG
jgi:hypothetical protein